MQESRPVETKTRVNSRATLASRLPPVSAPTFRMSGKKGIEESTYTSATSCAFVKSAADVPARYHEPRQVDVPQPSRCFAACSTMQDSAHAGIVRTDPDFFSKARMEERADDDVRHGQDIIPTRSGAGRMQRTVDIMRKRECDPKMAPPKPAFDAIERRCLNGVPSSTPLETVRFTYTMPQSSQQLEYRPPHALYPPSLDQSFAKQRRVISECAVAKDLFAATTKAQDDVLPGFMGHIPTDDRVLGTLRGSSDTLRQYAHSGHMAAAKPGSIAAPRPARSSKSLCTTTQGEAQLQAVSFPNERALNKTLGGQK